MGRRRKAALRRSRQGHPVRDTTIADLSTADAYLDTLLDALRNRARGGVVLDGFKVVVALVSLVVTVPLALFSWFDGPTSGSFPPFRWPWADLRSVQSDVDAAKSAIAVAHVSGDSGPGSTLYGLLDQLEPSRRPSHVWLGAFVRQIETLAAPKSVDDGRRT